MTQGKGDEIEMISLDEILVKQKADTSKYKVGVCVTSYNQQDVIEDALNGILKQKTTFPFLIVVADDYSTDGTRDILKRYKEQYPGTIELILQPHNLGLFKNRKEIFKSCDAPYIAFCDGDDYWTDEGKLQKQFNSMERHNEIDICAHAVRKINAASGKALGMIAPEGKDTIIRIESVIIGGGGFVGTNSLFYRKSAFDNVLPFRKLLEIDYTLQVQGALRGGMLYLSECMSDYRFMSSEGSWSSRYNDEDVVNRNYARWKVMTEQLDVDTNKRYHDIIVKYMDLREIDRLFRFGHYNELKKYRYILESLTGNTKIKYYVMINFPQVYFLLKSIRDKIKSENG